jgi:plasmid stabilization system protein ParE
MKLVVHSAALLESVEAGSAYDQQQLGLGAKFDEALQAAAEAILEAPERWPLQPDGTRRYLVKRFPYAVIYDYQEGIVTIVAVMHLHREPGYWVDRL